MKPNVGKVDSAIRVVVGLLLLSLVVLVEGSARWIGLIGLLPLVTGLTRRCVAYIPFGINTQRQRPETGH